MMEIKEVVGLDFEFVSSTFGPIKVAVRVTGDEKMSGAVRRSLKEIKQRADAWMESEVLPCVASCVTQMGIFRQARDPLRRTAVVQGNGYKISCELLLEDVVECGRPEEDDIKLTALPWALLGKSDKHAREAVRKRHTKLASGLRVGQQMV